MTEISSATKPWMNVSTSGQKHLVIVGATGMVGGYALRYGLDHPAVRSRDGTKTRANSASTSRTWAKLVRGGAINDDPSRCHQD